ncbi:MAG: glutamate--cysteine ligase [Gammaproteobacteria bacterium]|nr:MAG: glutamate--cysteine ligase [Gammaproteobacteria bacterium]
MTEHAVVPHLTTAQTGPLLTIERHLLDHQTGIETWFRDRWRETPPPFYASVDLRNAGFKISPVDTNLFPAGFNNLSPAFLPLCVQAVQVAMQRVCGEACRVLLVPESHTRNRFYLESLATLEAILEQAGYEVRIGTINPEITRETVIELESGRSLRLEPLRREGDRVMVEGYTPCLVLLNNDLSAGRPEILEGLSQPVVPPLAIGWANRLKSVHFAHYRDVANEFARLVELDPWLLQPLFRNCGEVDFMKGEGVGCLHVNTEKLLREIRAKYEEYGIDQEPVVFVKADSGTYGMGVMTVRHADEVLALNRKQRTRMSKSKEGLRISNVIIQEGVPTSERVDDHAAEPVVYMIDRYVVGGFYRVHAERGEADNLNAPGMRFEPLAFAESCITPDPAREPDAGPNRFYAYGVVARLALLAAARELAALG